MPRWDVTLKNGSSEDVGANALRIEGGALIFDLDDGVIAYGPTAWTLVEKSEA
jgi:hypothetical protein